MNLLGFQRQDLRLTWNLTKMNLRTRYLGSALGLAWAVLNPLLLLGMYTFVFGFINKARVPGAETTLSYAIWLISGFVPYLAISESLTGTAGSVLGASNLVKNVIFKSELLPLAATMTAGVPFVFGMAFLGILLLADGNYFSWHIAMLPVAIAFQFAFLAGLGFFLSATTVFLRDILQFLTTLTLLIVFFSPIFYTMESMPEPIQKITFFNPFYQMVEPYRQILIHHAMPDWKGLAYLGGCSAVLMVLGLGYFRRLKGYFEIAI